MTYGTGTRSYNRSPEKRQADQERAAATAAWKPGQTVLVPTGCPCCKRVRCVWGKGPVYASSPQWIKEEEFAKRGLYGQDYKDALAAAEKASALASGKCQEPPRVKPIFTNPQ